MNMRLKLKHIYVGALIGMGGLAMTSCNDFLERAPISQITRNLISQQWIRWVIMCLTITTPNSKIPTEPKCIIKRPGIPACNVMMPIPITC